MPNISKISRDLNKDRRTIAKVLRGEMAKKTQKNKYLDIFRNIIIELLTINIENLITYNTCMIILKENTKLNVVTLH